MTATAEPAPHAVLGGPGHGVAIAASVHPPPGDPATTASPTAAVAAVGSRAEVAGSGRVWAYLGIVVGAVVSIAANVAHSFVRPAEIPAATVWRPEPGAVLGATFWPVALLITTEIMARTNWPPGRAWLLLRFAGLLPVAAVAGIVSYLHLHGLLAHYHEARVTCLIAPLSVDGLMVMASSALVASTRSPASGTPAPAVHAEGAEPDRDPASNDIGAGKQAGTAARIARLAGQHPGLTTAQIARQAGVSARTARRHLAAYRTATSSTAGADSGPPARPASGQARDGAPDTATP